MALEVGLAEVWRSWGIEPDLVMGRSVGELAAAIVAGVMSLEDGLRLATLRGQLMQSLPDGAMAAIFADEAVVAEAIAASGADVTICGINSPGEITIGGASAAVEVASRLRRNGSHRPPSQGGCRVPFTADRINPPGLA